MTEKPLSDDEVDVIYRQMIDSFIDRANELADQNSPENVGMALLFAASRFNAFTDTSSLSGRKVYHSDCARKPEMASIAPASISSSCS